ncbi:MAG: hypothetical protein H6799_03330 [Candidatus Nomurabacteria bacterium]|nr:MAG: hypothetical protein H6799_03330 [Candidatus Nomurabacteria bacterium]HRV75975.1 hypothetical protein [Candidatus Saccharimonadales bacterium]
MEILQEDKDLVLKRLDQIKRELNDLTDEFRQTLSESSETWHDNSPWDNAKAKEAVLLFEQERLQRIIKEYRVIDTKSQSPLGKKYEADFNGKRVKVYLAGDFSMRTGEMIEGHMVVTKNSPVGEKILLAN